MISSEKDSSGGIEDEVSAIVDVEGVAIKSIMAVESVSAVIIGWAIGEENRRVRV